jgi:hypothetical protein
MPRHDAYTADRHTRVGRLLLEARIFLVLTSACRSATVQRLEHLIKTGESNADELASLQKNVDALRSGVKLTEIGPDVEQQLCKLLDISDTALQAIMQYRILNSVSFGEMHRRFDSVAHANHATFEWILEETPGKNAETLEIKASFRDWLLSGSGIFHIAGKLGSGKSTLMKFLCSDHRTTDFLETWAAGKQLVIARFFFWKPGTEMENSINGLVRTLLYDVLKQCPELLSLVFPEQWQEVQELPWQAPVKLRLDSDEINKAFRRLIDCRNSKKPRCFCFFIDGLDEFEGGGKQDYGDLVDLLRKWTQVTPEDTELCKDIKLCVSSREDNVFVDSFADTQRLRLQDLNRADLVNFVQERFESHRLFSTLEFTETTRDMFVDQIVDQAAGVFLWATLVMITLREGLDDGDGLSELQSKLDSTPSDLKRLFRNLIAKIHERDRQQSARTFSIISTLWKYLREDRITLFAYSFLDDLGKDSEFAFTLPTGPRVSDEEVAQRLKRARKQLYGRCRGLVEIRDRPPWAFNPPFLKTALQHDITVVHRSIHEFLESTESQDWIVPYLKEFSPVDAICQLTIAMIKRLCPMEAQETSEEDHGLTPMHFHSEICQTLRCLSGNRLETEIQLKILDCLDGALPQLQCRDSAVSPQIVYCYPNRKSVDRPLPYFRTSDNRYFLGIQHAAADIGLHEYVAWNVETDRGLSYEPWEITGFLEIAIRNLRQSSYLLPFIESLFKRGISPNMTTTQYAETALVDTPKEAALSVWQIFFLKHLFDILGLDEPCIQIMEILLKFGADPHISISLPQPDGVGNDSDGYKVLVSFPPSDKQHFANSTTRADSKSAVIDFLRAKGGKASLRDILEHLLEHRESDNARTFLALIDQNMKPIEQSPTALEEQPSLLSKEVELLPLLKKDESSLASSPEKAESSLPSSDKEEMAKEEQPIDEAKGSKGGISSQLKKYMGAEKAQIFLERILKSPFAPFLLGQNIVSPVRIHEEINFFAGVVITYLYFYFTSS